MYRRYRLEWRPPASVEATPSLAFASDFDTAIEARSDGVRLVSDGLAAFDEVRISVIGPDGVALESAIADIAGIRLWRCDLSTLPPSKTRSRWGLDEERELASLQANATLRLAMNRAVRSGAVDIRQALGLIAHSARLLDPDED